MTLKNVEKRINYRMRRLSRRKNYMIDAMDKQIYFPKSFNEQMAWIEEEVEHIIEYNDKYNIKKKIQEKGRDAYGQSSDTH